MFAYSGLERDVDEKTPGWVLSCNAIKEMFGWEVFVPFKDKRVHKAKFQDGKWTSSCNKGAYPDFVLLDEDEWKVYSEAAERKALGYQHPDIFKSKMIRPSLFLEVFGEHFHSGGYVQGKGMEEHEQEVVEAYRSAGAEVLVLWGRDIDCNWDDVCMPSLSSFLSKSGRRYAGWGEGVVFDKDVVLSLKDAVYWRELDCDGRDAVVEKLLSNYRKTGFPFPTLSEARHEFRMFMAWSKGSCVKSSIYGRRACEFFTRSSADARVKGRMSLGELWKDDGLMEECIRWQLGNESGRHSAKRFLAAMTYRSGFRSVSGMSPSDAFRAIKPHIVTGGILLDPCAGWGGRMLACHAAGMRYVGIDANARLVSELREMAAFFGIDAEIHHGDSSSDGFIEKVLAGRKADIVFTSPPYFDREVYSADPEQSVIVHGDSLSWGKGFLAVMAGACRRACSGAVMFNLPSWIDLSVLDGVGYCYDPFLMRYSTGMRGERLVRIGETDGRIRCAVCGGSFDRIGIHARKAHGMTAREYREKYGGSLSSRRVQEVASKPRGKRGPYEKHSRYVLPDGRVVRRRDAWVRAWGSSCDSLAETV